MARTSTSASKTEASPKKDKVAETAAPRNRRPAKPAAPTGIGPEGWRRLFYLASLAACGFTALSLASYDPADPGFTRRSTVETVANWCGRSGALVADTLYQAFGWTAWSVLPLAAWFFLRLARRGASVWRLFFGLLSSWWTAAFLGLLFSPDTGVPFPRAGALGVASAEILLEQVGPVGSYILVLVLLFGALTVSFGIELETLAGRSVEAVSGLEVGDRVVSAGTGVWGRLAQKLAERRAAAAELASIADEDEDDVSEELALAQRVAIPIDEPSVGFPASSGPTRSRGVEIGTMSGASATQVQRRDLVEVQEEPTRAGQPVRKPAPRPTLTPDEEPAPAPRIERPTVAKPKAPDYDVAMARTPATPLKASPAPYAESEDEGSIFEEERPSRPSALDPVDPRWVHPPLSEVEEEDETTGFEVPDASRLPNEEEEPEVPVVLTPPSRPSTPKVAPAPRPVSAPARAVQLQAKITPGNLVSGGAEDVHIERPSEPDRVWELPHLSLLDAHDRAVGAVDEEELKELASVLVEKLSDFGVNGEVTAIRPGPVITIFEYLPAPGVKLSRIAALQDDIAMAMKAERVRIVAPIPGKGVVGIEIPNRSRQTVWYRDLMVSKEFRDKEWVLPMALGRSPEGRPVFADLATAPHLLVAGTTGSGKSVGVNAMLLTMLYYRNPEELRLILIDPKMLEFELYNHIPHLLHPVVTDPKLAAAALKWACDEMDDRYRLLARWGTRNISSYNEKVVEELKDWTAAKARRYAPRGLAEGEAPPLPKKLPYIVVVIDELADLMMTSGKEVEQNIARLAQKSRACGIHLIVATQRPSTDIITGVIKSNLPTRISYQVRSKVDGRVILDQNGAEALLGKGDMLYLPPGSGNLGRIHGPFVSDQEVTRVADFLREQGEPDYSAEIKIDEKEGSTDIDPDEFDEVYDMALEIAAESGKISTSMIQRRLKIGYNRAARLIEMMEKQGIVGPADGARPREVLQVPGR